MANPFKRNAAEHRPALRPIPGSSPWEVESSASEWLRPDDEDSDWAVWEDSLEPPDGLEGRNPGDS